MKKHSQLQNPWLVTILGGVIVGVLVKLIFIPFGRVEPVSVKQPAEIKASEPAEPSPKPVDEKKEEKKTNEAQVWPRSLRLTAGETVNEPAMGSLFSFHIESQDGEEYGVLSISSHNQQESFPTFGPSQKPQKIQTHSGTFHIGITNVDLVRRRITISITQIQNGGSM